LVVIECKKPGLNNDAVKEGISQFLRNQKTDEIPELFTFSQILLSVAQNRAKYATTGTPDEFWAVWKEADSKAQEAELSVLINKPLSSAEKAKIFSERQRHIRVEMEKLWNEGHRLPSAQDQTIHFLLRPARLLELIYQFIVF